MLRTSEQRWLVSGTAWRDLVTKQPTSDEVGYVAESHGNTVRVEVADGQNGVHGTLVCLHNPNHRTAVDDQIAVPFPEARRWLREFCGQRTLRLLRYQVPHGGNTFEVHVFKDYLEPLTLATITLQGKPKGVWVPGWCTDEVTNDVAYSTYALAHHGQPHSFAAWLRGQPSY